MEIDPQKLKAMKQAISELTALVYNLDVESAICPARFPGFINGYKGYGCEGGNHIGRHSIRYTHDSSTIVLLEWDT